MFVSAIEQCELAISIRGQQRTRWSEGITDSIDMSLCKFREMVKDREAWRVAVHGVTKSRTRPSGWTTTINISPPSFLLLLKLSIINWGILLCSIQWVAAVHYHESAIGIYISPPSFLLLLNLSIINWGIIALQYWVGCCRTSPCISHRYTYFPSLLNLPPISPSHPSRPSQSTDLSSLCYIAASH